MSDAQQKLEAIKRLILADLDATTNDELRNELIEDGECPEKVAKDMKVSLETLIQKFQPAAGMGVPAPPSTTIPTASEYLDQQFPPGVATRDWIDGWDSCRQFAAGVDASSAPFTLSTPIDSPLRAHGVMAGAPIQHESPEKWVSKGDMKRAHSAAILDGKAISTCSCACCVEAAAMRDHAGDHDLRRACHCKAYPKDERCDCPFCAAMLTAFEVPTAGVTPSDRAQSKGGA